MFTAYIVSAFIVSLSPFTYQKKMILNLASRMPFYQKYFDKDFEKNLFSVKRSVGVQPCCGWECHLPFGHSLYAFMSCSVSSMYKRICIHYVILQRDYFSLEGMTESIVF